MWLYFEAKLSDFWGVEYLLFSFTTTLVFFIQTAIIIIVLIFIFMNIFKDIKLVFAPSWFLVWRYSFVWNIEHSGYSMAHTHGSKSPNFSKFSSVDLNVSAELSALKDEVNNKFAGRFFREIDSLKALTQQRNYFGMGSNEDSSEGNAIGSNNLSDRIKKLEQEFSAELTRISERIDHLLSYVKNNARRLDDLDQDRRSCSLIFQGVAESDTMAPDRQVLQIMKNKLELFIPEYPCCANDPDGASSELIPPYVIARAFRMGKPRTAAQIAKMGPRPIMVHFGSLHFRDKVFTARKSLKGSKLFICESLTRPRYELLLRAREVAGKKNAWSADGKIFAIVNDVKRKIDSLDDLQPSTNWLSYQHMVK
jgi:hypothetical protein